MSVCLRGRNMKVYVADWIIAILLGIVVVLIVQAIWRQRQQRETVIERMLEDTFVKALTAVGTGVENFAETKALMGVVKTFKSVPELLDRASESLSCLF